MKTLKDKILEKIDIDKVNLDVEESYFPLERDINYIIWFLKHNGFTEIPYENGDIWVHVHEKFDKNKGKKVFEYWPQVKVLRFANMKKDISEKNPVFIINSDGYSHSFAIEPELNSSKLIEIRKKEFSKLLKKVFKW